VAPIHHDARRECNTAPLRPIASVYDEFMAGWPGPAPPRRPVDVLLRSAAANRGRRHRRAQLSPRCGRTRHALSPAVGLV